MKHSDAITANHAQEVKRMYHTYVDNTAQICTKCPSKIALYKERLISFYDKQLREHKSKEEELKKKAATEAVKAYREAGGKK